MSVVLATTRTIPDVLVFITSAAIILCGAVGVIISKNPVHSALCLIATFLGIALAFVEQQAHFLAAVQIIVYAGAIVILFLFVIMFLGVDRNESLRVEPLAGHRPIAVGAIAVVTGALIALMAAGGWYSGAHSVAGALQPDHDVNVLGKSVFTTYLLAFESTALLLIIAVVGAVLLARRDPGELTADSPKPEAPAEAVDAAPGATAAGEVPSDEVIP